MKRRWGGKGRRVQGRMNYRKQKGKYRIIPDITERKRKEKRKMYFIHFGKQI